MKTFPLVLLTAILVLSGAGTGHAQNTESVRDALNDAQHALMRGDTETAKQEFKMVLEIDPHNVTALNYMRTIVAQEKASGDNGAAREKQLQKLVLPRVELKDATFGTALDYLKQSAAKAGVADVSFVVQVPQDVADTKKVTLSLSNIPFTEVLHYMGDLTGFKFTVEKYAISVKAQEATAAAAASPAPASTP